LGVGEFKQYVLWSFMMRMGRKNVGEGWMELWGEFLELVCSFSVWFWRLKKGMIVVVSGFMIWWWRWNGYGAGLGLRRGKGGKWELMEVVLFCLAMILKILNWITKVFTICNYTFHPYPLMKLNVHVHVHIICIILFSYFFYLN
jgi:hypothetical protein